MLDNDAANKEQSQIKSIGHFGGGGGEGDLLGDIDVGVLVVGLKVTPTIVGVAVVGVEVVGITVGLGVGGGG